MNEHELGCVLHSLGACGRSVFQTGTKSSTWKVRVVTCSCEDRQMNSRSGCAQGTCVPKVSECVAALRGLSAVWARVHA